MIVADLKQHLADLARLLESAGAKGSVPKDLAAVADGLTPFAGQTLPEFSRFLALAHEYKTTGKLEAPARPARASKAAAPRPDIEETARRIRQLYDRAGDLSLTMLHIETELGALKGLKKDGLLRVCDAMELVGMGKKTMPLIVGAIRQKILGRRSAAQRADMIQNPTGELPG